MGLIFTRSFVLVVELVIVDDLYASLLVVQWE